MIKSVTVTNYLGDSLKLELARPEKSGFVIKSITGLGPGKAAINTTEVSTTDGALFNSSRLPSRNIVISLAFLWKKTIEDVRLLSYKYFPIKKNVTLLIETDNRKAEIQGYVETNEPTIFSNSEGSEISIICPNPYFYSAGEDGETLTVFSGVEPAFEFPFCNDSLTEPLLEMSIIQNQTEKTIVYEGDADIGMTITIHAIGEASNITIHNIYTRESMHINTSMVAGDDIIINTVKGHKSISRVRGGEITNILNCLSKDSDWFQLIKGDNLFAYTADSGAENLQFKITNRVVYEGV